MKKDYTVLLIQLDGNLASDVSTRCSFPEDDQSIWSKRRKLSSHQVESREPCNHSSVCLLLCATDNTNINVSLQFLLWLFFLPLCSQSALGWEPLPSPEEANASVGTRLRQLDAPLAEYLLSRSVAGATHDDIIAGIQKLTRGRVIGHFCHMHPSPPKDLSSWLRGWIDKAVVPLASLNLQKAVPENQPIPDAWHHQMIYGATSSSVYLTNPREETTLSVIEQQLCSESVLLIRRADIVSRWSPSVQWELIGDGRWAELNVTENIKKMMLEYVSMSEETLNLTHVTIPAVYKSGITLFAIEGSPGAQQIKELLLPNEGCLELQ